MAAPLPAGNLANLLSLPARHFAVIDAGSQRVRILVASVAHGRPRLERVVVVDTFEEAGTSPEETRESVRQHLREIAPEAIVLVAPQRQVLRQVLDLPPGDAAHTRALLEREASSMGGLSESRWAVDSTRLRPFGRLAHPLAAAFCRQDHLEELIDAWTEDEYEVFEIRAAGDALAAAFRTASPATSDAVLVDLGAEHTAITVLVDGQAVFVTSFPSGSALLTRALAADRGCTPESAEVLKRTEIVAVSPAATPTVHATIESWLAELERTLREWLDDHPELAEVSRNWTAFLAGGGALQPGIVELLAARSPRRFAAWPGVEGGRRSIPPDCAGAWGALLLSLGLGGAAPSLLPPEHRAFWNRQRFWRLLLIANLALAGLLGFALFAACSNQTALLARKRLWREQANRALQSARDIRVVAEGFNSRMDALRPVLEAERQTVETLQVLAVLQNRRTNAQHWYVLLADAVSYGAGSNNFTPPPPRPVEPRVAATPSLVNTNPPPPARAFIAEICLVPQGEQMRQSLSELIGELKQFQLFRNVDVLSPERRRLLVATNLIFPERHFALELNLSEAELLPALPLPKPALTNREPTRSGFRIAPRTEPSAAATNPHPGRAR